MIAATRMTWAARSSSRPVWMCSIGCGDDWRIGATLRNASNAGTGHYNPGSETVPLMVAVPLR